jgi:hypothetical protein
MKAKVLKQFRDKHTGELHKEGTTIDIDRERLAEILTVGPLVEPIKAGKANKPKEKE